MRRPALFALLCLLVGGCSDSQGDGASPSREAVTAPTGGEREAKQAWREPGTTEVAEVDWGRAATLPSVDVSALPEQARSQIAEATLPVLLPRDPALHAGIVITRGESWYSASLRPEGHHITIHGTKQMVHQPALAEEIPPERRRADGEPAISRTHGIVSLDFSAFGAAYTVDVECERPMEDTRCTEDGYARAVFEGLGLAGGAQ